MQINVDRLTQVLDRAHEEIWTSSIPQVSMRIRVAIQLLSNNSQSAWDMSASELLSALENNTKAHKIFSASDENTIAFAMRTARIAAR